MVNQLDNARNIVAEALSLDLQNVDESSSHISLNGWDSLAVMRIVMAIENVIGKDLPMDEAGTLFSVKNIAIVLDSHLSAKQSNQNILTAVQRDVNESYGNFLRKRLQGGDILPLIGVFDQFSASLAGREFDGIFCSGYGFAASYYGLPDEGYIAWPDIVNYVERMRAILPQTHLVVDIDEGYGDPNIAASVVKRLERVGASAVVLEDQRRPKQCGHLEGKEVMAFDDYMRRLEAVLTARDSLFVVARSDSTSFDDGLVRVSEYAKSGADAIMLEGLSAVSDVARVADVVQGRAKVVVNLIAGGKTPPVTLTELKKNGADLVIYSTPCLFNAHQAIVDGLKKLKERDGMLVLEDSGIDFMENVNLFRDNLQNMLRD